MKFQATDCSKSLQILVEELLKAKPSQTLVKKLMLENNIPYSVDPIFQMGQVLAVINSQSLVNRHTSKDFNVMNSTGQINGRKGDKEL